MTAPVQDGGQESWPSNQCWIGMNIRDKLALFCFMQVKGRQSRWPEPTLGVAAES
jgi:hypothetical protein